MSQRSLFWKYSAMCSSSPFPLQSLLELEVDLDNLELEDIDTTDINLDEDILDDWV